MSTRLANSAEDAPREKKNRLLKTAEKLSFSAENPSPPRGGGALLKKSFGPFSAMSLDSAIADQRWDIAAHILVIGLIQAQQCKNKLSKKGSPKGLCPFGNNLSPSPCEGEGDKRGEVRQPQNPL